MLYIVEALRYGDREKHSYVVGVFTSIRTAYETAVVHEYWRGGKYSCVVSEHSIDNYNFEEWDACVESALSRDAFVGEVTNRINEHNSKNESIRGLDELIVLSQKSGMYNI